MNENQSDFGYFQARETARRLAFERFVDAVLHDDEPSRRLWLADPAPAPDPSVADDTVLEPIARAG